MIIKVPLDKYLPYKGINYPPGAEVDVSDDIGIMLIEQGSAELSEKALVKKEEGQNDD